MVYNAIYNTIKKTIEVLDYTMNLTIATIFYPILYFMNKKEDKTKNEKEQTK